MLLTTRIKFCFVYCGPDKCNCEQTVDSRHVDANQLIDPWQVTIFSKKNCSYCTKAKALLEQLSIPYIEYVYEDDYTKEQLQELVPGAKSVPQIFNGKHHVGGFNELELYLKKNKIVNNTQHH